MEVDIWLPLEPPSDEGGHGRQPKVRKDKEENQGSGDSDTPTCPEALELRRLQTAFGWQPLVCCDDVRGRFCRSGRSTGAGHLGRATVLQQNENPGLMSHKSLRRCRYCYIHADIKRDHLRWFLGETAPNAGLFAPCFPMLGPLTCFPSDPMHTELRLAEYFIAILVADLLSERGRDAYSAAWNAGVEMVRPGLGRTKACSPANAEDWTD